MSSRFPGGGSRQPQPLSETERLAERIVQGLEPIPHDLPAHGASALRDAIRDRLRNRLLRFLARVIVTDMETNAQEKGPC